MTARRGLCAAAVLIVAGLLAACAGPAPGRAAPAGPPETGTGWERVPVGGTVRAIEGLDSQDPPPHLTVAGDRAGRPLLADVTGGRVLDLTGRLPAELRGPLAAVAADGDVVAVGLAVRPPGAGPAAVWAGYAFPDLAGRFERWPVADAAGRAPAWVTPLLDGEEDARVVGAVAVAGHWRLHVWHQDGARSSLLDRTGPEVLAAAGDTAVLAGTTEAGVLVAGALHDATGPGRGRAVWWLDDPLDGSQPTWLRQELSPPADDLTDLRCWSVGCWVAGVRDGSPVVHEVTDRVGPEVAGPRTVLDPARPAVLLAGLPVAAPMLLATQSADGPTVWQARPDRTWVRIPAPAGRLTAARRVGAGVYVVVDGVLWRRELPAPPDG